MELSGQCRFLFGAGDESRTRDLNLGKVALYQLSYSRFVSALCPAAEDANYGDPLLGCQALFPKILEEWRMSPLQYVCSSAFRAEAGGLVLYGSGIALANFKSVNSCAIIQGCSGMDCR